VKKDLLDQKATQVKKDLLDQKATQVKKDLLDQKVMPVKKVLRDQRATQVNQEQWVPLVPQVQLVQKETPVLGFHLCLQTFMDK
jgi:hypothetical protein